MSADIEKVDVIKDPTVATRAKDQMLVRLKAKFKPKSPTEQSPVPKPAAGLDLPVAKTMATTSIGEILRMIHDHLDSYPAKGMFEPFDVAARKAEIEYVNTPQLIEGIFKELLLPGNENLVVIDVIRKHLANLLKNFPDHLLPLAQLEPELSHFACCLLLIAAKEHHRTNLLSNQSPAKSLPPATDPVVTIEMLDDTDLADLEAIAALVEGNTVAGTHDLPTHREAIASTLTTPPTEASTEEVSASAVLETSLTSSAPFSLAIAHPSTQSVRLAPQQKVSSTALIFSGALALASASIVAITSRTETPSRSDNRTTVPLEPVYTNTTLPAPSPIPEIPPSPQPQQPRTVTVSSNFFFGTQSSLERGVRTALLSNTEALAHCITRPNTDPRHLAYGLTPPITNFIRRSGWTVGSVSHPRGIRITWTDDGRCNDFKVTGVEQRDAIMPNTIVYPETPVRIAKPIADIVRDRALYHRLPVSNQ